MSPRAVDGQLDEPAAEIVATLLVSPRGLRPIARIRATVDRERAAAELGLAMETRPRDALLGASVGIVEPPDGSGPVALLEPDHEGRIAATLARRGEDWAGWYVAAPDGLDAVRARARSAGIALSRSAVGPFGRTVLVLGGLTAGTHLVIVDRPAGTIRR